MEKKDENILEVSHLKTSFSTEHGVFPAVDDISFSLKRGETLGIIGESGCGKSVTALSIIGLIDQPPGKLEGEIKFLNQELLNLKERDLENIRGDQIAMIFQEPMTSLHPMHRCGYQIVETLQAHMSIDKKEGEKEAIRLLGIVGIPNPEQIVHSFPHELSGGLRQRVLIAIALSCKPSILIADEITTAVDVTIQAQVLELLKRLKEELGMSVIMITHDMGVIAETTERVIVMYTGKIVEEADVVSLFESPSHPYTQGLLESIPRIVLDGGDRKKLKTIEGKVPNIMELPPGCPFEPRCEYAMDICRREWPRRVEVAEEHFVFCWKIIREQENR